MVTDHEATILFTDNTERYAYLQAIRWDMVMPHRFSDSDPAQAWVKEHFGGRLATYAKEKDRSDHGRVHAGFFPRPENGCCRRTSSALRSSWFPIAKPSCAEKRPQWGVFPPNKYGGMVTDQLRELKRLQKENERLGKAVSELTLDKLFLAKAAKGNF